MVDIRMKEYQCNKLKHIMQSALLKPNIETGHQILDKMITILLHHIFQVQRGYRDIETSHNLNRDNGYNINKI